MEADPFMRYPGRRERGGRMFRQLRVMVALAAAVFTLQTGCPGDAIPVDWKWLGKDVKDCQWYYDVENVKHLPEGKAMVWMKRVVNDEQRKQALWERVKNRHPVEGYDRWDYEVGLMEIDCREGTIRQLSIHDYDKDGRFLKARDIRDNLKAITRESIGEMVYREICSPREIDPRNTTPRFPSSW